MSVQLLILSKDQQTHLLNRLQENALFPYTFQVNRTMTAPNFPTADVSGGGSYVGLTFTPQNSIGIAAVTYTLFQSSAGTFYRQVAQVSLGPTMSLGDASSLIQPTDQGNIISRGSFVNDGLNGYVCYLPSTYYVQANVPIYIYFWIETAGIGSGNTYLGTVILHTIQTGSGV